MTEILLSRGRVQVYTEYANKDKCTSVPGGVWSKRFMCWEYPLQALREVVAVFPGANMGEGIDAEIHRQKQIYDSVEALKSGKTKPRDHPFLMEHQRLGRDLALRQPKYALYYDIGTGKTILSYSIIEDRLDEKWLVICPKSIINAAWVQDAINFFPHLKVLPVYADAKVEMYKGLAEQWGVAEIIGHTKGKAIVDELLNFADVVVTNVEYFKNRKFIQEWPHNGLIIDESSILRNKDTANTKAMLQHAFDMKFAYLLSGKPAPNNEMEYFAQMAIVNPAIFGASYYRFRSTYFESHDFYQREWSMKPSRKDEFSERLAEGCIFIRKDDCLDLPEEQPPMRRSVTLSPALRKYYRDMERDRVLVLEDKTVSAAMKVSSLMKLRQITSGFVIDTGLAETTTLGNDKINELGELLTELGDNKAIIWINFKEEVRVISDMLDKMGKTYVTAYGGTKNVDDSIIAFQNDSAQYMIANPKSLKYGVTFTGPVMKRNCTYAIYVSLSHSFEDLHQSKGRIHRKGQTESCTYIYLIADNTIDEDIYDSVVKKGTDAEIIENMVRRVKNG